MAENLGASFSIDVTNLKAGLDKANAMIKLSKAEFDKFAAGLDSTSDSQEKLEGKLKSLNDIQKLQREKVKALKEQYQDLISKGLDPSSEQALKLETNITKEETALAKTEAQIKNTTTQLQKLGDESEDTGGELKDLKTDTDKATGGFDTMKVALGNLVADGIEKAIGAFKDLAKFAVDAYKAVDEGSDNLIRETGVTGEEAEKLKESYQNVAKTFKGDFGTIGTVMGAVSTRFGYTGEKLEETTKQFLRFADITGTDAKTAVESVAKALKAAGLDNENYTDLLDQMAAASQQSGVSIGTLTDGLVKNGAQFRAMGFDTSDTIALLSQFEAAGVNSETAVTGLKTAMKNWTDQGKDSKTEFDKVVKQIQDAPDDVKKLQIAYENFGKKAGPELADAISTGRTSYEDFVTSLQNSQGTVKETYDATKDSFDDIDIAIQNVKTEFAGFVNDLMKEYGPTLKEGFKIIGNAIKGALEFIFDFVSSLGEALGQLIVWLEKAWTSVKNFMKSVTGTALDKNYDSMMDDIRSQYEDKNGKISNADWNAMLDKAGVARNMANAKGGHFATGGVVTRATRAIIGEDGAEAVMPLEKNTGWIDKLADKLAAKSGGGVVVNQTNNYAQSHSRYEIWQSEQNVRKAVKAVIS